MIEFLFVMSAEQSEKTEKILRRLDAADAARTEKQITFRLPGLVCGC
jgi:hypothetical protein